jgi:hypothetical protein
MSTSLASLVHEFKRVARQHPREGARYHPAVRAAGLRAIAAGRAEGIVQTRLSSIPTVPPTTETLGGAGGDALCPEEGDLRVEPQRERVGVEGLAGSRGSQREQTGRRGGQGGPRRYDRAPRHRLDGRERRALADDEVDLTPLAIASVEEVRLRRIMG